MVSYIHANLPVNGIVRLPHSRSGDSQGQETFLAPSAFKRTRNYDTECSNHHLSQPTSRSKLLSRSMMKWWDIYIKKFTSKCHSQTTPSSEQRQRGPGNVFNTPSADKETCNYIYIYIYIYIYLYIYIYIYMYVYIYIERDRYIDR